MEAKRMQLCCGARLRELEKRRPRGELPGPAGGQESWGGTLGQGWGARTRGSSWSLAGGRLQEEIGKKFCPLRALRAWPRLPRGAGGTPALAVPKARLGGTGGSLV